MYEPLDPQIVKENNKKLVLLTLNIIFSIGCFMYMQISWYLQISLLGSHVYYFLDEYRVCFPLYLYLQGRYDKIILKINNLPINAYLFKPIPNDKFERSHHLDAIRGLAAVVVAWYHIFQYGISADSFSQRIIKEKGWQFYILRDGYIAVRLFVVLSGYILAQVYWTPRRSKDIKKLMLGRISRFYPLHFFTAILYFCCRAYLINNYHKDARKHLTSSYFFSCLSLTHFWSYTHNPNLVITCNGPAWSLSAEWMLNIIMFIIIRYLPIYWGMLFFEISAWFGYHVMMTGLLGGSYTFELMYPFFLGVLSYQILGKFKTNRRLFQYSGDAFTAYVVYQMPYFLNRNKDHNYVGGTGEGVWSNYHMAAYSVWLIIALENSHFCKRFLSLKCFTFLGTISFSVYLSHAFMLHGYQIISAHWETPRIEDSFGLFSFTISVLFLSMVIHYEFEVKAKVYFDAIFKRI